MKTKHKILLFSLLLGGIICAVTFVVIIGRTHTKAELSVESEPEASVYVDGKLVGVTPQTIETTNMKLVLKIIPRESLKGYLPYETALSLTPQTKTIVRRKFADKIESSTTQILSFVKNTGNDALMTVSTNPQSAYIFVNNEYLGTSPLQIHKPASTYSVQVMHTGFQSVHLSLKSANGYDLTAYIDMAKQLPPTKTPPVTERDSSSPVVSILKTPTGYLRVHESPSELGQEISRALSGREYSFEGYSPLKDWIEINLNASQSGWILSQFATVSGYIATPP